MQFWRLIFVAFFANYFSLNQTTECVDLLSKFNGKLRPSFEEIFGKGWDEEEKKQQNNGQMEEKNGEENGISIDQISENDKMEKQNKINDQKREGQLTDREKRVVIEKFHLLREKLKEIGKFPGTKRAKIERQIGKQLGVGRAKIYKWKRELGKQQNRKYFSDQQKRKTIEKFHLLRQKLKANGKFPGKKRAKIERQIGNELGVCRKIIYKWKRELGIKGMEEKGTNSMRN